MLIRREITALERAGLNPDLREEIAAQAEGSAWVRVYRWYLAPWWVLALATLAVVSSTFMQDIVHPLWFVMAVILAPMAVMELGLRAVTWSPDPAVRFRNRLITLSINASRRWGGDKAQLDLAELADFVEGADNASTAVVLLTPYQQKRRLYHTTYMMGLSLFVLTIAFFIVGLPLLLGLF